MVPITEKALAERISKRDRKAFAKVYERYAERIYRYIYYKSGRTDEAEDLTAQVFLKAWEAVAGYRWEGYPFSTWLYRIAHNQVIDFYRTHHESYPLDVLQAKDSGNDPFEAAQSVFTSAKIRSALQHLTQEQRRVVTLRFLEGYTTKEVAAIMCKNADSIRALQHRALRALQPWINEENGVAGTKAGSAAISA